MNEFKTILKQLSNADEATRNKAKEQIRSITNSIHNLVMDINGPIRNDENTRQAAKIKLEEIWRYIGDLSVIYNAIELTYPDDMEEFYGSTRYKLLWLLNHYHDQKTHEFIFRVFPNLPHNLDIQGSAFSALMSINTQDSIHCLAHLLSKYKPDVKHAGIFFIQLYKRTENVRALFPEIFNALEIKELRHSFYELLSCARNNGHITTSNITTEDISQIRNKLVADLKSENKRRQKLNIKGDKYRESCDLICVILEFLGSFQNDKEVTSLIRQYSDDSDSRIIMNALLALVYQGKTVERKMFYRVAADPITRIVLYEGLERLGKTQLFPDEFYNQESFAEAIMINWLRSGMEMGKPPDKIQLLTSREIEGGDTNERIFIYKFWYKSDPHGWIVGQSGPQPIDSSKVSTESYLTFSNFEKLNEKTIDEHVGSILEYLESISRKS